MVMIFILSVCFLSFYAYESVFQGNIEYRTAIFVLRVIIAYIVSGIVVSLVLLSIDKFPLLSDQIISLKRLIIITMPAPMGAIVVDSFDKE